ncbi:TCR/Tet family MFS transporter [Paracoccus sp. KR1-242]|uniref:TCR/Tet family MFS transporter n=1 Tax=Paracoccus sp. KR1-242 TaxID=3410028 RepID=UPI003BFAD1DA
MNKSLVIIFITIMLDAIGIGLIFPILPALLRDVTHAENVVPYIGAMVALYAVMQLVFAPVLGAISDRIGRRPVLLVSLGGAAINYILMVLAPSLWLLFLGRAIAGQTSANVSVAMAYITDISAEDQRARRFGLVSAMFGIGFVIGPVIGGVLGDHWLRLPFIVASVLNGCNLALALFMLPESRKPGGEKVALSTLNPLRPLMWAFRMKSALPILLLFFLFSATGEAYAICWALWGSDTFHWSGLMIGLSLGTFGAFQALAQLFLPGPAAMLLGERGAILAGVACACTALTTMALATHGWLVFAILPLFALGGIGTPALQSLATRQVDDAFQGQFQGVLASVVSFASIVAPLVFSSVYSAVQAQWPGAIWLAVTAIYALTVPLVVRL